MIYAICEKMIYRKQSYYILYKTNYQPYMHLISFIFEVYKSFLVNLICIWGVNIQDLQRYQLTFFNFKCQDI